MITKYEDYINEGFYDWMNKKTADEDDNTVLMLTTFGSLFWIAKHFAETKTWDTIMLLVIILVYIPGTALVTRSILRNAYNNIRGALFIGKSAKIYEQVKAFLEKYPDLKEPLIRLKIRMNAAIKRNNKKEVSAILHELYKIKKNISKREKAGDFFILNDEEKEIYNRRENDLNKIDPFREEEWNEK